MAVKEIRTTPLTDDELQTIWVAQLQSTAQLCEDAVAHKGTGDDGYDYLHCALSFAEKLTHLWYDGGVDELTKMFQLPPTVDDSVMGQDAGGGFAEEVYTLQRQYHQSTCEDDDGCLACTPRCQCDNPLEHATPAGARDPQCASLAITILHHPDEDFDTLFVCMACIAHQDDEYADTKVQPILIRGTTAEG